MNERFSPAAASALPGGRDRQESAARAQAAERPSIETEEWRYSPIGDLDLGRFQPAAVAPEVLIGDPLADEIGERAATVKVVDGWVVEVDVEPGWVEKGLEIAADPATAWQPVDEQTVFDFAHQAFSPAALTVKVPRGLTVRAPIVIIDHHQGGDIASFPHLAVSAADGADVLVVHHVASAAGGLSVPVVELDAGPAARVRYELIQELDEGHWSFGRQRSSAAAQATLVSAIAAFGARYGRTRTDSRLTGRGASASLIAAYYGDGDQVHDFRTFQHHDARDTRSDLWFKGTQDGASGSIYTGMIHIHPDGAGSNAFQTNRNVKLSPDAWAWSVPNLEIENNDVHCSHASTVSPVDPEQQFYLHSRGVPPVIADRLIVEGFFDEVIDRMPVEALRGRIESLVAAKLNKRVAS